MSTVPWTISLPEDLSRTLRHRIPARGRSRFISDAVRKALEQNRRTDLTRVFLDAVRAARPSTEEADLRAWGSTLADGLSEEPPIVVPRAARRKRG